MHLLDITDQQFETIASEIDNPTLQCGEIEMISGWHALQGRTILLRDAGRCMLLAANLTCLDPHRSGQASVTPAKLN